MVEPFWFTLTTTTGATLTYKTFFNPIDPDRVNQGLVATNGSAKLQQWLPSNVSQTSLSYASPTVNNWGGYNTQSDSDPTTVSSLRGALDSSSALVTTDAYSLSPDGTAFEVRRSVKYVPASLGDASPGTGFDSTFGFTGPTTPGSDYQFFCPGQLYGSTRLDGGTLITPEATGNQKLWLSTLESTLPMMMMRHVPTGTTLIMAHMSEPSTALNAPPSSPSEFSSAAYTFGSFGGERGYGGTRINGFRYPASTTAPSDSTMTWRFHPSLTETVHEYTLRFMVYSTSSFEDAVDLAWRTGTDWFAPRIRPIDIPRLYDALGRCLGLYANKYSGDVAGTLPSSDPTSSGSACVPSAFVRSGAIESIPTTVTTSCPQVRAASYLYARALRRMEFTFAEKAEAVLSAWASRTSENGMIEATTSPIRTADMLEVAHPLLDASEAAERAGFASLASAWRATAMGFADFLVRAQNPDGSWAASYESDGSVSSADPWATPHCLAFLADVTGETYASATAAATQFLGTHDWGLAPSPSTDVHRLFGALVDRARVTGDAGLLAKARAMATYVESLVYAYEFPTMPSYDMEDPYASTSSTPSPWPACGISGHSRYLGATVTWCAADFYSLYRLTQDSRYLRAARLVHHNAQRSCDWDGKLGWCQRGVGPDSYSYDALPVLGTQGPAIFSSFRLAMQLGGLVRLETQWGDASLDVLAPPSPSNPRLRARNVQVRDASAESIVLSAPSMSASVESLSVLRGGSTGARGPGWAKPRHGWP